MTSLTPDQFVSALLPRLRSQHVTYFPIRHHSPACAWHLRRWIERHRPAAVLVEGPESFNPLIPLLVDPRCVCPVAVYTSYADRQGRLLPKELAEAVGHESLEPPRFAGYYPFCDFSPELIALRTGQAVGAQLRFIDLDYAEQLLARHEAGQAAAGADEPILVQSLAADPHLRYSEYVQAVARKLGCRDHDELWDHLFEAPADGLETDAFIDRVAAYCAMARFDYTEETLTQDGTLAREACMAAAIAEAVEQAPEAGPVLVVTGGFHTVALPELVARGVKRPKRPRLSEDETGTWLIRYSFDRLDALSGYTAGMPSPGYYDRLWQAGAKAEGNTTWDRLSSLSTKTDRNVCPTKHDQVAAAIVVEVARLTRERRLPTAVSTADAIAALDHVRRLASLRGHPGPTREDVLDGIRSCFVKGEMDGEGQVLMQLVHEILAGDRVGTVPPGAGVPAIVADFRRHLQRLRLASDSTKPRELALDLYRKANHRQISRLLHRLNLLGVPFGQFQRGPDFVRGHGLDLMQEHWRVAWSPDIESSLIEASVYGATVQEAAGARLRRTIAQLEDEGQGRSAQAAVSVLIQACRMGLHDQTARLVELVDAHIAQDPALDSLVNSLTQLDLLAHSREPLEATHLTAVTALIAAAYQRACRLAADVGHCPDEVVEAMIEALRALREVLADAEPANSADDGTSELDPSLFHSALHRVLATPPAQARPAVVGAAAGILFGEGQLSEADLLRLVTGYLNSAMIERHVSCHVLRGLLATAREATWRVPGLLQAVDSQLAAWDEETFLRVLPDLRLAFTDLNPREVTRVAQGVADLHGGTDLGELVQADLEEQDVRLCLQLDHLVRQTLSADGLSGNPPP